MRCIKCHYLSFEPEPRCKNCGHDLSMEDVNTEPGFDWSVSSGSVGRSGSAAAVMTAPAPAMAPAVSKASSRIPTGDLPLFVRAMPGASSPDLLADEPEELAPMIKVPSRPRSPIAVRRTTPDPARLRAKYGMTEPDLLSDLQAGPLDRFDLREQESALQDLPLIASPTMPWPSEPTPQRLPAEWQQGVGAFTRLVSAAIDATLLGSIYVTVIYLTMRITGLSVLQLGLLPILPMAGLFLLLTFGYLLMFTAASGQTLGKMAMNIRVVGTSPHAVINDRVTLSQAVVRTLTALPSALLFGLGFVPALVGAGVSVHDRIAHTRVVNL